MITKSRMENLAAQTRNVGSSSKHKEYKWACGSNRDQCTGSFDALIGECVHGSFDAAKRCIRNRKKKDA